MLNAPRAPSPALTGQEGGRPCTHMWSPMTPSSPLQYRFKLFNKHKREWDIKTLQNTTKSSMWDNNKKKIEKVSDHPLGCHYFTKENHPKLMSIIYWQ